MQPSTKAKQRTYIRELVAAIRHGATQRLIVRRLHVLLSELHNRKGLRGRRSSASTRRVIRAVRRIKRRDPRMSMQEIAVRCRCSIGRVSEILRGKRT